MSYIIIYILVHLDEISNKFALNKWVKIISSNNKGELVSREEQDTQIEEKIK